MRRWFILALLALSSLGYANTYYVASSGGKDSNPGTISQPWATWQKAFDTANQGDTVYFRGGVWYPSVYVQHNPSDGHGFNGTYDNPICFFNYPGEEPILDAINFTSTIDEPALALVRDTYIKIRGLTIRNKKEKITNHFISAVQIIDDNLATNVIYLDRITSHDNGGHGFRFYGYDTLYVTNCDSYNNADIMSDDPGNRADGFSLGAGEPETDTTKVMYMSGCRAWHNSDDGFDIGSTRQYHIHNNWSFINGYLPYGAGVGFKLTNSYIRMPSKRRIFNNLSAFNHYDGFSAQNLQEAYYGPVNEIYNNTSYRDMEAFSADQGSYSCNGGYMNVIYRNNLAYKSHYGYNDYYKIYITTCGALPNHPTQDHNSWIWMSDSPYWLDNPAFNVSDSDFEFVGYSEVDSTAAITQLSSPRKVDGSLPDITFLKLKEGSDLIDKGVDVGLPYSGSAPDLGYSEYDSGSGIPTLPVFLSAVIENATPSRVDMTFNVPLANILPAVSAFTVKVNTNARNVSSVAISGSKVILTLASPVTYGDVVTVAYTKPSANQLQTTAGGQAASLSTQNVINNVTPPSPAYVSSVIENATPSRLEMTYSLTLANFIPATSAFTVTVNTTTKSISSVAISGTKVMLTLTSPVTYGDVVTVAYSKPSANPLQTPVGGQAISLTAQSVINNCSIITNQPPVVSISSPTKATEFTAPANITIDATASDSDGTISNVEFFNGSSKLGECTKLPYSFTWKNVTEGTYSLTAVATDNLNSKSNSPPVTVTVQKSSGTVNQFPVINIKRPNKGGKYKKNDNIVIEAEASDPDGEIIKVEFKNGATTIAEILTAPYVYIMENADTGKYVITAVATDNLGATSASSETEFIIFDPYYLDLDHVKLYPNPNDGHFTLDLSNYDPEYAPDRICIFDMSGKTIINDVLSDQQIFRELNLINASPGTYVIMLTRNNLIISTGKLVIQ